MDDSLSDFRAIGCIWDIVFPATRAVVIHISQRQESSPNLVKKVGMYFTQVWNYVD